MGSMREKVQKARSTNIILTAEKNQMYFPEDIAIIIHISWISKQCARQQTYMIGPKNFTSFTDDSENKDPVRRVTNIKIVSNGEKLRITYYGTGFMYHMVRIMTGTLLEVGTGEREASMIPVVIAAEDRSLAGFLAPARGLFLRKVYY